MALYQGDTWKHDAARLTNTQKEWLISIGCVVGPVFRTVTKQGLWLLGEDVSHGWNGKTAAAVHAGVSV